MYAQKRGLSFWNWLFIHLFSVSLFLTIFFQLLVVTLLHKYYNGAASPLTEAIYLGIMTVCQWSVIISAFIVLSKHIWLSDIGPIMYLYSAQLVAFSGLYLTIFVLWNDTFDYPDWLLENQNYWDKALAFFAYSVSVQTLTGVSELTPVNIIVEIISGLQMAIGIGYNIFILTIAVQRFAEPIIQSNYISDDNTDGVDTNMGTNMPLLAAAPNPISAAAAQTRKIHNLQHFSDIYDPSPMLPPSALARQSTFEITQNPSHCERFRYICANCRNICSIMGGIINCCLCFCCFLCLDYSGGHAYTSVHATASQFGYSSFYYYFCFRNRWRYFKRYLRSKLIPNFVRYMVWFTVGIAVIKCLLFRFAIAGESIWIIGATQRNFLLFYLIFDVCFLIFSVLSVLYCMAHLATNESFQINVSIWTLINGYIAMIVLFGILFLDMFFYDRTTFVISEIVESSMSQMNYWQFVGHFLYFSITNMSNCGVTSSVIARTAVTQFCVAFQNLSGVLFHVVVFGAGLLTISSKRNAAAEQFVAQQSELLTLIGAPQESVNVPTTPFSRGGLSVGMSPYPFPTAHETSEMAINKATHLQSYPSVPSMNRLRSRTKKPLDYADTITPDKRLNSKLHTSTHEMSPLGLNMGGGGAAGDATYLPLAPPANDVSYNTFNTNTAPQTQQPSTHSNESSPMRDGSRPTFREGSPPSRQIEISVASIDPKIEPIAEKQRRRSYVLNKSGLLPRAVRRLVKASDELIGNTIMKSQIEATHSIPMPHDFASDESSPRYNITPRKVDKAPLLTIGVDSSDMEKIKHRPTKHDLKPEVSDGDQ